MQSTVIKLLGTEWSGSMASTVFTHHVILYIVMISCQSFWLSFLTRKVEPSKVLEKNCAIVMDC